MDILRRVQEFIRRHSLLSPGDAVVVGVSGGPDSLCLLHLLVRLREEYHLRLHVAHLHHGARGEEADADAAFVADLARRWGLPATIAKKDVPAIARAHKLAFEEAARRVRYAFLARVAGDVGASKIAVGHNADDQAETVLMHFLRGAGPAGLRGMLPVTPLSDYRLLEPVADGPLPSPLPLLIRPLLDVPRAGIEAYCAAYGLEPRFDRSNLDTTYFRNRLRHELLPLLETYNPNIRRRLCHTAHVVAADYALLEELRDRAWDEVVQEETEQAVVFDRAGWRDQPLSLRRALIRKAAYHLRPTLRDVDFVHVEDARRVAEEGTTGAQATLPGGLMLTVGYDTLTIAEAGYEPPPEGPTMPPGVETEVALPGITPLPEAGWALEAEILETWTLEEVEVNPDRWTAYLDADRLEKPLVLRTRRSGDRFRPQGMGGHGPRLTDWMINAKVPRAWRDRLPLLVAGGEVVWVCGWRVAETAIVGPETRRVARFRFVEKNRGDAEGTEETP
ncbi:MAG TPA: tRNA lysidine(34) synthetase TilS [Thermoflexia bacterium]|nr:tRNA lysidine(34) synthetase TilS [Thermoflexia bacterium]